MSEPGDTPRDQPGDQPGEPGEPGVGSVSEEALKLVGALSDWAREHGSDLGQGISDLADNVQHAHPGAAAMTGEHLATGARECTWCPVCRVVHAVRQTSPEARAHLTAAASSLAQAAAALLATGVPPRERPDDPGVERIDLDEEDDE